MSTSMFSVGLDVHKDSVTIAVFRNRDPEPMRVDRLPQRSQEAAPVLERLAAEGSVRACYEASGAGYVLQRALADWGFTCELAAPSLIPTRPGEHRKTDRRDAIKIARDFRDDRLVLIHIPTEDDERVRDLVRCRETFQREIIKSRHYILKFLRRPPLREPSPAHGLPRTRARRAFLGDRRRLGAITKAGNARVRHVLIQAAWHYRRRPAVGAALRRRQEGQDPSVLAHAWKCQHRLYKVLHRLAAERPKQVAATAVAREMVGFLWATLTDLDIAALQHSEVSRAA